MKIDSQLLEFAKSMRSNATNAEHLIWQVLRTKRFMNLKFCRQHVIEAYIVDFYCHEIGLVIELDGDQHITVGGKEENFKTDLVLIYALFNLRYYFY